MRGKCRSLFLFITALLQIILLEMKYMDEIICCASALVEISVKFSKHNFIEVDRI